MKLSDRSYIIILFIVIFSLGFLTFRQFKSFSKPLESPFPEFSLPEIDMKKEILSELEREVVWVSPDQKFKLTYTIDWVNFTDLFFGQTESFGLMMEEADLLLFAQKLLSQRALAVYLSINKLSEIKPVEAIVAKIEEEAEEDVISEIKFWEEDDINWIEVFSEPLDQPKTYSKTMVLYIEEATYLISFSLEHSAWSSFKREAEEIFDSVEVISMEEA